MVFTRGSLESVVESFHCRFYNQRDLSFVRHQFFPNPNKTKLPNPERKSTQCEYNIRHPLPYIYNAKSEPHEYDIIQKLLKDKSTHQKGMIKLHEAYKKNNKNVEIGKRNVHKYSTAVLYYHHLRTRDPDPYFHGSYNWYFTGSALSSLQRYPGYVYFSPIGVELNKLQIKKSWDLDNSQTINMPSTIFEIRSMSDLIMVRERLKCSILSTSMNEYKIKMSVDSTKIPFISGDIVKGGKQFCTSDMDRTIKIWNLGRKKPTDIIQVDLDKNVNDNWNTVKSISSNNILHADRCCVKVYDCRNSNMKSCLTFCPEASLELCDEISCIGSSEFDQLFYVGTTHSLLAVDIRFTKNSNENIVNRWAHMQYLPPTNIDTCLSSNGDEMIFINNHQVNDSKFIVNQDSGYYSPYPPRSIYSIHDSFQLAQKSGTCLNPTSSLSSRIKYSCIGMLAINENKHPFLLSLNATGDIFKHSIDSKQNKYVKLEEDTKNQMQSWMNELDANVQPKRHRVNHLVNFEDIANEVIDDTPPSPENVSLEELCIRKKPKWNRSIRRLRSFQDVFAKNILDMWDMDDFDNDMSCVKEESTIDGLISTRNDRVTDWLSSTQTEFVEVKNEPNIDANTNNLFNESNASIAGPSKLSIRKSKKLKRDERIGF